MATDERSFGYLLRRYRLAALLTQEQLAERAHLSHRTISDLERGAKHSPRRDTVLLLADALELSPGERAALIAAAHPVEEAAKARGCPGCGARLSHGERFCGVCGMQLEPDVTPSARSAPPPALSAVLQPTVSSPAPVPQAEISPPSAAISRDPEERRLVTSLFCDLVGFTQLTEQLDPEEVREIQAAYFSAMGAHITRYGGTIEKYIGDAVVAIFGVPAVHEDDAERAVRCALAMQQAIGPVAEDVQRRHGVALALTVGVDSGEVVTGSWDVAGRQDVSVTGGSLSAAQRIQAAAAPGEVLVGVATMRLTERCVE